MATNNLFNQPLMNKYLRKYKKEISLSHSRKEAVLKWIKKLEKGELKEEVSNYGNFSRIILENILGYDYEENIVENVKEQYGRGLSEFAIEKDNKKFMVIELKGSNADLDKPQNRKADKRTPVDQAFDYAKRSGDIDWIFVSNYNEFRLYNWHKKEHLYISFKAEDLQDPETFSKFMLIFSKFSTIEHNLIDKLISKTMFVERDLESEFYKLYSETRLMLIAELEHIHPEVTREESVHNAQLILNRYIFICFAEDLGLLPEEISVKTIESVTNLRGTEIWHNLNGLFLDVNNGSEFREEEIFAYNGGLFSEDLEYLRIRDIVKDQSIFNDAYQNWKFEEYSAIVEDKLSHYNDKINPIYKNLMTMSSFNFSSELDVNILGHIFENSIGEIEELKADKKGRRKKEGIFYTPEYITDYICRNTIIPYLSKSGNVNTIKDLLSEYRESEVEELEGKVRKIRIVDPACGSGAFLNKAGDILVEIHQAIRKHKYKDDKSLIPYFDTIKERRKILLDNIYGVDLNEESVEITKLSLFLKVCKTGLKLPNLDNNIKWGNSLIEDPRYTDRPFSWKSEFKDIFKNGGFDIVIGNPPYIRHHGLKDLKSYLKQNYNLFKSLADIYVYFFEKGLDILKQSGRLGFISSNKFIKVSYGLLLRKLIAEDITFEKYVDHTYDDIFIDATAYPSIFILKKEKPNKISKILVNNSFEIEQSRLSSDAWGFEKPELLDLRDKLNKKGIKIKDIVELNFYIGIMTGYNDAFFIDKNKRDQLISQDPKNTEIIKPLIRGKDIKPWKLEYHNFYVIVSAFKDINELKKYPFIYNHFKEHEKGLLNRGTYKRGDHEWWVLSNNPSIGYLSQFEKPKLIYPAIALKLFTAYDESGFYTNDTSYIITSEDYNLKYLGILLSSKTLNYAFKFLGSPLQGQNYKLGKRFVEQLPIYPATPEQQKPFIEKSDDILKYNRELISEINGFKDWLQRTYQIVKFSQKLDKYYKLSLDDFLTELNKKKVDTKQRRTQEILKSEFEASINKINPLLLKIEKTDNEIDQMVYELYGLTVDEIKIIEESLR